MMYCTAALYQAYSFDSVDFLYGTYLHRRRKMFTNWFDAKMMATRRLLARAHDQVVVTRDQSIKVCSDWALSSLSTTRQMPKAIWQGVKENALFAWKNPARAFRNTLDLAHSVAKGMWARRTELGLGMVAGATVRTAVKFALAGAALTTPAVIVSAMIAGASAGAVTHCVKVWWRNRKKPEGKRESYRKGLLKSVATGAFGALAGYFMFGSSVAEAAEIPTTGHAIPADGLQQIASAPPAALHAAHSAIQEAAHHSEGIVPGPRMQEIIDNIHHASTALPRVLENHLSPGEFKGISDAVAMLPANARANLHDMAEAITTAANPAEQHARIAAYCQKASQLLVKRFPFASETMKLAAADADPGAVARTTATVATAVARETKHEAVSAGKKVMAAGTQTTAHTIQEAAHHSEGIVPGPRMQEIIDNIHHASTALPRVLENHLSPGEFKGISDAVAMLPANARANLHDMAEAITTAANPAEQHARIAAYCQRASQLLDKRFPFASETMKLAAADADPGAVARTTTTVASQMAKGAKKEAILAASEKGHRGAATVKDAVKSFKALQREWRDAVYKYANYDKAQAIAHKMRNLVHKNPGLTTDTRMSNNKLLMALKS